ncbi:helix-turn-helix transcriptional regulator [Hyphomicrobium sp.]|uniref:response regulator transcription factor n=1 Tax=Hyphomicrobium sp. TaxID=82 RepID=UPI000F9A4F04|nr:helix-turn-helix transcriptional regulator [Hyphomicrobium sp.]RUP09842.1 MAG: LuxR family transcriptional regulator [Hyphomicrobium sp.]
MKPSTSREPPVYVVLIDNRGVIMDVSAKAGPADGNQKIALGQYTVGDSYFDHCDDDHRTDIQSLLKRKRSLISFVVPSRPKQKQWFVVIGVPVSSDASSGAVLMHVDIAAWVPEAKETDTVSKAQKAPVTLNPGLIQDTIARALFQQFGPGFSEAPAAPILPPDVESLSPRQREVLMLLGAGKSNAEIAEELSCSLNTVKRHVTAVLQKLRLPNRTRAAMLANQLNMRAKG